MTFIRVQVVGMTKLEGISSKTGKPYSIRRAQCVCVIDGQTLVAQADIPRDMANVQPGAYDVAIRPYVREGELHFAIASYVPVAHKASA